MASVQCFLFVLVQLLLEHLEAISPDHNDLLHEVLQDLGDVPDVEALLGRLVWVCAHAWMWFLGFFTLCCVIAGEGAVHPNDPNRESALGQLAKTEISLTLTSKFELLEGDDQDLKTLLTK